jgi:WD40 repeat protein
MPARDDSSLKLWNLDDLGAPIHTFQGHKDVVKEFVWRGKVTLVIKELCSVV